MNLLSLNVLLGVKVLKIISEDGKSSGQAMAERLGVSYPGLSKHTLQPLAKAQLIYGARGAGGGYVLAKSPDEITLLDVVEAISGFIRVTRDDPALKNMKRVHRAMERAIGKFRDALIAGTIQDLVEKGG